MHISVFLPSAGVWALSHAVWGRIFTEPDQQKWRLATILTTIAAFTIRFLNML